MKRRRFLQYLAHHGCAVVGEGRRHTRVYNQARDLQSFVPRHGEIKPGMIRTICKQLSVPVPSER